MLACSIAATNRFLFSERLISSIFDRLNRHHPLQAETANGDRERFTLIEQADQRRDVQDSCGTCPKSREVNHPRRSKSRDCYKVLDNHKRGCYQRSSIPI